MKFASQSKSKLKSKSKSKRTVANVLRDEDRPPAYFGTAPTRQTAPNNKLFGLRDTLALPSNRVTSQTY